MKWIDNIYAVYRDLQEYTKAVLIFSSLYLFLIAVSCIGFYISAGTLLDYYTAIQIVNDLISAFRACIGISVLGAIATESALHAQ